jgi:hypothetical protein
MWEYQRLKFTGKSPDEVFKTLNVMGKDGWEVIQYTERGVAFSHTKDSTYIIILKKKT